MTRKKRIDADQIRLNLRFPRHPRAIHRIKKRLPF
jgi:hypothetical protein